MKIFAIDPGPKQSAAVEWDGRRIIRKGIFGNDSLREMLWEEENWRSADRALVIEQIASYGMPVGAEVFETCVWTGRFMEAWNGAWSVPALLPYRIPRKEICVHLCGSARAKDANIRQALIDRLGAPGTKKNPGVTYGVKEDIWAALAVAVTAYDRFKIGALA